MRSVPLLILLALAGCNQEEAHQGRVQVVLDNTTPSDLYLAPSQLSVNLTSIDLVESSEEVGAVSNLWLDPAGQSFELTRPTESVNADLASQSSIVEKGTYDFVRVKICAVTFTVEGVTAPYTYQPDPCDVVAVRLDPPLTVSEHTRIGLSLRYDLANSIVASPTAADSRCVQTDDGASYRCFAGITFVPAIL